MVPLLHLDSIGIQLGANTLFSEVRLVIPERAKIGIIGPNGAGKSTLLKIMAGILEPDTGRVIRSDNHRIVYVPQMEEFQPGETVLEAVLRKTASSSAYHNSEVEASKVLSQAGFSDLHQEVEVLSGGWRKRLSLAAALSEQPELLLLDEPTNHLDLEGLTWLEDILQKANFAWALVSHDRYFLDKTVQKIFEISPTFPNGYFESDGGYFEYKEKKQEFLLQEAKRTSALANKARRELEWASRSPKARTGKAAYRMKEAERLKEELKAAKARKPQEQKMTAFQTSGRGTKELVELIKCSFAFGDHKIFQDLNHTLKNKMCLGLLGRNGQGKSTLLKLIGKELEPTGGKVKHVAGLKIVYFDQLREALTEWRSLGELLGEGHDHVVYQGKQAHIIGWGRRFGFDPEDHAKSIKTLSGGEQARALLSILVRQEADLLLLDEPTNDLDIPMLEALETMILEFEGAVVLVTHDRFMLDEVCTNFLGFTADGKIIETASFEQWIANRENLKNTSSNKSDNSRVPISRSKQPSGKLTYNDQREYGKIEGKIVKAEEKLAAIEKEAADPAVHADLEKSAAVTQKLADAKKEVERLYQRWEELDSLKRSYEQQK